MAGEKILELPDRGVVSVKGADARKLLQGLVTNDMDPLRQSGDAIHAALLMPQGKILFDFFIVATSDGFLLETAAAGADALAKRLTLYRLRADAAITNETQRYHVFALWNGAHLPGGTTALLYADPRHPDLGQRALIETELGIKNLPTTATPEDYAELRVSLGVPESGFDYALSDIYPHEADFDLFNGVSFKKGCFVGQEVVARMQNKTVVRKRIVKIRAATPLHTGHDINIGEIPIGKVGTVSGSNALALVRLDRAVEALDKDIPITSGDVAIEVDEAALRRYRTAAEKA